MISVILDNLAAGETHEAIMQGYHLEETDIQAALHSEVVGMLRQEGHDAVTVHEQQL